MTDDARDESDVAVVNNGFNVLRCAVHPAHHDEDEVGVKWRLSPALTEFQDFAVVGDLTIRSANLFSGVQIICYLNILDRDEPLTDGDWPIADRLLTEIAPSLTHPMYDYAALQTRIQLAGFIRPHRVPSATPEHQLLLAGDPDVKQHSIETPPPEE